MQAGQVPVPAWTKYTKEKLLGAGSFGRVFLVKKAAAEGEAPDPTPYVVKRTPMDELSPQLMDATATEVYVLSMLSHPNILRYIDHFVDTETHLNLVTEFCACGDLQQAIEQRRDAGGEFDDEAASYITFQLLLGIDYCHKAQVMHRDLKPGNVFLGPNLAVKIGDFGISKMISSKSMATTMVGTPFYLSPEVVNNLAYTHPSDMWSLGCVVYEVVTLQRPFVGGNILAIAQAVSTCTYPPVPAPRARFGRLVEQLLLKDPAQRATAASLLQNYFSYSQPLKAGVHQAVYDALCKRQF
eukprot:TRINITY_DN23741_c0_g1_i1.p1 TRINITY_DN23741_c0_g1~~TRINITY_DN23741_c0_g1_i1.p1  ORF type:complete len:315 (+),score=116.22 TRINITY_DN23741_c0_g1_i1:54-947(+)